MHNHISSYISNNGDDFGKILLVEDIFETYDINNRKR